MTKVVQNKQDLFYRRI